jgi:chitin disaccharide deacetylase
VAPRNTVASLVDANGYFHHDWSPVMYIDSKDAERELRAQIDRAYTMGIQPTHLDSHQYRLILNGKDLFDVFLRVAHDYKLPIFVTRDWFAENPYLESSLTQDEFVLDHTVTIAPSVPPEKWAEFYRTALKNLQPGITEFVIHVAMADDEMKAATRERDTWGAAWRQRDFDFFTSQEFRRLLRQQDIKLTTWRQLVRAANHGDGNPNAN